ncbi:MAG: lipoate---protein ligase [Thermoproteota archaeon]|nr:lipoate---protein ligase [Thermoproteota archaeon]
MVENWRVLDLNINDAYLNMAIDEAICRLRAENRSPNTIRFYRWKPSAVSLGYFQLVDQEVNLNACKKLGVDVIRRMTGGGAVYHSFEGEVTYSIIVNQSHPKIPADIIRSYEVICSGIVGSMKNLGINAEFTPINDICVNGKKISGNAQTRRWGVLVQHGTILLDTDIKTMFTVLKVSKEKISDKMIKSAEERVTTIRRELGRKVEFEEVTSALKETFPKVFDMKLVKGDLNDEEKTLATKLKKEKYSTREWIFNRPITIPQ